MKGEDEWDRVTVLRKKPQRDTRSAAAVNTALAKGQNVDVSKKINAGTNKTVVQSAETRRIAESDDIIPPTLVSRDVGKAIMRARQEIKITQKKLAAKICEKPDIIHDYELGKGVLNPTILNKLERILKVKLRGAGLGTPIK